MAAAAVHGHFRDTLYSGGGVSGRSGFAAVAAARPHRHRCRGAVSPAASDFNSGVGRIPVHCATPTRPSGRNHMSIKFDRTRLITPALLVAFILIWHFYVTLSGISRFIIPPPLEVWDALI